MSLYLRARELVAKPPEKVAAGCASSATLPRYQVLNLTSGEVLVVNEASLDGYVYAVCF